MALPFQEGDCFFVRESFHSEGYYNANDSKDFYNYFMIEYLGNEYADIGPGLDPSKCVVTSPLALMLTALLSSFRSLTSFDLSTSTNPSSLSLSRKGSSTLSFNFPPKLINTTGTSLNATAVVEIGDIGELIGGVVGGIIDGIISHSIPVALCLDKYDLNFPTIFKYPTGLDLEWGHAPVDQNWLTAFFKNVASVALGLIPGIGLLLLAVFDVGWVIIEDPDSADKTLLKLVPGIGGNLINSVRECAKETQKMRKNFLAIGDEPQGGWLKSY